MRIKDDIIIRYMRDFYGQDVQDMGLFTFYRQQAEYEEKLQAERIQLELREKLLREEQQQHKRKQKYQLKKRKLTDKVQRQVYKQVEKKNRYPYSIRASPIQSMIHSPKKDYSEDAKKYLKLLEQSKSNRLIQNTKRKRKNYIKKTEIDSKNFSYDTSQKVSAYQSGQIFIKKKEKVNNQLILQKSILTPKEFDSIELLRIADGENEYTNKKQYSLDFLKKKRTTDLTKFTDSTQKLPKIQTQASVLNSKAIASTQRKNNIHLNYYNHLDILFNNEKFKLKQLQQSKRLNDKIIEDTLNTQMIDMRNQMALLLRRNRMK